MQAALVASGLAGVTVTGGSGIFTVTLEDGEVWQESSSWPTLAKWKLPAASYYVSILPGVLGSYDLKVRGINGYFKVHRLR